MHRQSLGKLLEDVAAGRVSVEAALETLRRLPFEDLPFARLDHHRHLRCGLPEVVFGEGKTPGQLATIFASLAETGENVLATRVSPEAAERVRRDLPQAEYDATARTLVLRQRPIEPAAARVAVVSAGTSDLPVAEEARISGELLGLHVEALCDVGVAGLHRLTGEIERLREADVLIVVAGMEGALPSVVGGLVEAPIVAVPASVGYGVSFGGVAALLAMLNSCSAGVSVVNIDNGFGAACVAARIASRIARAAGSPQEPAS